MRIVCVSDTHGHHAGLAVPDGDLLIHAGDATMSGSPEELDEFDAWLGTLPHRHKVVIAGNHDRLFEDQPEEARRRITNALYLQDAERVVDGVRIWGSPWQPWFLSWAFNLKRGAALRAKWALIPPGIDVLVTHGPPHLIRDRVKGAMAQGLNIALGHGPNVGCEELREAVRRVRPRLHVFGHIHEGYGREEADGTLFVNASICDEAYRPVNPPVVVDLDPLVKSATGRS
jgi:predicted phosphodiesterase